MVTAADDDASAARGLVETRAAMGDLVAYLHDAGPDPTVRPVPRAQWPFVLGAGTMRM